MTTLAPAPLATEATPDEGLSHVVCCIDDIALCGTVVADLDWMDDDEDPTCVVCRELENKPCRICGH